MALSAPLFNQVASDLITIWIEAWRDSEDAVPAVATATALDPTLFPVDPVTKKPVLVGFAPDAQVTAANFSKITQYANQVDTVAAMAAGQGLRLLEQIVPFMSNESLTKIVENSVGTVTKKYAQKGLWCYYVCVDKAAITANHIYTWPKSTLTLTVK
ncbi:MAG: hypothetical protein ACLP29_09625 [Dissulfurispiraceae bacterium]